MAAIPASKARPGDGSVPLEQLFAYRLAALSNGFSLGTARIYSRRFGLSLIEWRIINTVHWHQPVSANEVAQRINLDKGNVSRAVARLLERRSLERTPNPRDQRRADLRLTPAGLRLFEQINPIAREREARLLSVLSEAERRALDGVLDRLLAQLRVVNAGSDEAPLTTPRRPPP